ncbi:MAG: hypothetical protein AB7R69_01910 [Candidatus Babeliales bacterium]
MEFIARPYRLSAYASKFSLKTWYGISCLLLLGLVALWYGTCYRILLSTIKNYKQGIATLEKGQQTLIQDNRLFHDLERSIKTLKDSIQEAKNKALPFDEYSKLFCSLVEESGLSLQSFSSEQKMNKKGSPRTVVHSAVQGSFENSIKLLQVIEKNLPATTIHCCDIKKVHDAVLQMSLVLKFNEGVGV